MITRSIQPALDHVLRRGKSVLLLGPRQTGKTTMLSGVEADLYISINTPEKRVQYEQSPSVLKEEVVAAAADKNRPLIVIDEIQRAPMLMDVVQALIDQQVAQFILTGSSARKLRRGKEMNMLPGRVVLMYMDPICIPECPKAYLRCEDLLVYGSLPSILTISDRQDKEVDLQSYSTIYLEEEIRAEAATRNVASFSSFLSLAASESGSAVNYSKLAQGVGVSHVTIQTYYQILEDCLMVEKIMPLTKTKLRRRLSKAPKYLFFDLGVRRICAKESSQLPRAYMGRLFEQFVALEILRYRHMSDPLLTLHYWRDHDGAEVDWVVARNGSYIPIEVKYTDMPTKKDARHLEVFIEEYGADKGYVICAIDRPRKLTDHVLALPWEQLLDVFT